MKKIKFIVYGLLMVFTSLAQSNDQVEKLKQAGEELSIPFEDLGNISLNDQLKLSDLYRIDRKFKVLAPLGKPIDINYTDHIGYETWEYKYADMTLGLINQSGYITMQSVTLNPTNESKFKIANEELVLNTKLRQIASFKSSMLDKQSEEVNVIVTSPQEPKVDGVKFRITLNEKGKTIKRIRIDFDGV